MSNTRNIQLIKSLSSFVALHTTGCEEAYESTEADRLDPETLARLLSECRDIVAGPVPTMTNKRRRGLATGETYYWVTVTCQGCYWKTGVKFAGWSSIVCGGCRAEIKRIGYGSK